MWPKTDVTKKITVKSFRSCFEKHFPADETYYFNGESHNFWEMVYITDGEWVVSADDRIYNLTEGHIIFHKPMEFHKLWKTSNSRAGCFVCSFDAEGDCSFLEEKVFKVNHSQRSLLESILVRFRMNSSGGLYGLSNNELSGHYIANTLENLFIILSEEHKTVNSVSDSTDAILFNKAVNILKMHISSNIPPDKVADMCNVSVSKLNKLFASYAGCGVHSYLVKLKVNEAILLLSEGYSSKEISNKLGFNNQNYFSITFKRETGLSPMNYKKKM